MNYFNPKLVHDFPGLRLPKRLGGWQSPAFTTCRLGNLLVQGFRLWFFSVIVCVSCTLVNQRRVGECELRQVQDSNYSWSLVSAAPGTKARKVRLGFTSLLEPSHEELRPHSFILWQYLILDFI